MLPAAHRCRPFPAPAVVLLISSLVLAACGGAATPSPSVVPTRTPAPTPTSTPTPEPTPTPSPTPEPTPTPTPYDQALLDSRLTVLVIGSDSSLDRRNNGYPWVNTDSLMVVSLSADKSHIVMLSFARDTVDVPLADGRIYRGKLNALLQDLGVVALKGAIATTLGIQIDGYVMVDMDGLVDLVDAVGVINVDVKTPVYEPKFGLNLLPGPTDLNGNSALAYSRTRRDGDYARAARQQQVVLALARKLVDPATQLNLPALLASVGSLQTDFDLSKLQTLVEMGRRAANAQVVQTVLGPPRFALFEGFEPGTSRGWVMIPNLAEMRAYVRSLIPD